MVNVQISTVTFKALSESPKNKAKKKSKIEKGSLFLQKKININLVKTERT